MSIEPANLAAQMAEANARQEEQDALREQLRQAYEDDRNRQLSMAVRMLSEMMGVSFEEAGRKVAERMARDKDAAPATPIL